MKPAWVLGAGGHAKVVIETLQATGAWDVVGLLDDDRRRWGTDVLGVPVQGEISQPSLTRHGVAQAVIAIGSNATREEMVRRLTNAVAWVSAVHPTAYLAAGVRVGAGTVVCAGAIIQPDTWIGDHAILNTLCGVDHDGVIGDFAHVGPGAHLGGGVTIGRGVLLGVGCCVAPGRVVGDWAIVGAGAAVVADVPARVIVKGVPARGDSN